jgi:hypothetical protein
MWVVLHVEQRCPEHRRELGMAGSVQVAACSGQQCDREDSGHVTT